WEKVEMIPYKGQQVRRAVFRKGLYRQCVSLLELVALNTEAGAAVQLLGTILPQRDGPVALYCAVVEDRLLLTAHEGWMKRQIDAVVARRTEESPPAHASLRLLSAGSHASRGLQLL